MNHYFEAVLLLAGCVSGYLIPEAARDLALYKSRKKEKASVPDPRHTAIPVRLGAAALNGAAWLLFGLLSEGIPEACLVSLLFSSALLTAATDIQIRLVPNEIVLAMAVLGAAFQAVRYGLSALPAAALCMIAMMMLFTAAAGFLGFGKIGAGDVKLAGAMGLALGYPDIVTALAVMCAAFMIFCIVGLFLKKLTLRTMLPFAPFMMSGMAFALICAVK